MVKIKENISYNERFHFHSVDETVVKEQIKFLDKRKATTHSNIPTNILIENNDIFAPIITKIYNECCESSTFPDLLKAADVTPIHKKEARTKKDNYRPISILPAVSKIFEKNMFDQISSYIEKHLSPYLCGFRKGYSTQHCLALMID